MTEQEKCETCKEVCRLDGYPEESRARYCKVKDKYINSDDNQCYIGKTYINVVIAARQQEPKHDYAVLFRSYKQGNGMGGLYGDPSEPDYIVAIYALGKKYVPATMTGKVKFVYDSDSDETSPERLSEHDAAIRKDERGRVLNRLTEESYMVPDGKPRRVVNFEDIELILKPKRDPPAECIWTEDEDGNWHTLCCRMYTISEGTPEENGMKYCPFCGKPLRSRQVQP
jgi:hypothetical protein